MSRRTPRPLALAVVLWGLAAACSGPTSDQVSSSTTELIAPLQSAPPPTTTTLLATTTTRAPTTTTTSATTLPPKGRVVISATGDVNFDPSYIETFKTRGYEYAFDGLQDIFLEDDLTIINLECAISDLGKPLDKSFTFRCDPAALPVIFSNGIEVANLANNHGGDFGKEALVDSRENLSAGGIAPVGVGEDLEAALDPALFEIAGWRIAVLGFGGVVPSRSWIATEDTAGMADGDDTELMVAAVEAAAESADLVFVTVHWGRELMLEPTSDDIARARAMIDAGADGIFGHHPHRLQAMEFYEGRPIAWSLGNFVWPNLSRAGSTTAVAQVIVEPDGSIQACLVPAFIDAPGHPVLQVDYTGPCQEG